jgi:hypothetical protein
MIRIEKPVTRDEDSICFFALDMKDQMALHEHKGELLDNEMIKLIELAEYNLNGLRFMASKGQFDERFWSECADLGNYAMMMSTIAKHKAGEK